MTATFLLIGLLAGQDPGVAKLIDLLGDDAVETRDAAEEKLKALGKNALSQLRKAAADHSDPEVRIRVGFLVRYFTQVRWHADVALARKKAAEEKRPLLVFSTVGPLDGFS